MEEVRLGWSWKALDAINAHAGHLMGNILAAEIGSGRDSVAPYVLDFLEKAEATSASDFIAAADIAGEMYATLGPVLDSFNVFLCPTTALAALPADFDPTQAADFQINGVDVDPFMGWGMAYPFNVMGRCPVMTVPSGHVRSGVPSGIQIVGQTYDDVSVFRAAAAYEKTRGWLDTPEHRPAL